MNDNNKMGEIIKASVEGIKSFTDMDAVVGKPIITDDFTVIPISKVTVSFASGGVDFYPKKSQTQSFGGGGGTSITVTPLAFLTVGKNSKIDLIELDGSTKRDKKNPMSSVTERFPDIIEKLKSIMS